MTYAKRRANQQGFTIVELMIATMVFTMVLLIATTGLLQISRLYYRGVIASRTQETTRSILDNVAEGIRLGGGTVEPTLVPVGAGAVKGSCAGGKRYSYELYKTMNETLPAQRHVLMADEMAACSSGTSAQDINGFIILGQEMMNNRMMLADFRICKPGDVTVCPGESAPASTSLYKVIVRVATGERDLFVNRNGDVDVSGNPIINDMDKPIECRTERTGSQFCAVSELSTVVQKRL